MKSALYACSLALVASLSVTAPALAEVQGATAAPEKRLVYVPHKSGYPFNFFHVPNERAEFARVEIDPSERAKRVLPSPKTGHPFLHNN